MLGTEMSPAWELEALKAQAVASRTYALYMRRHPKSTLYDLEKSTQDQVYRGASAESTRVLAAIQATRGEYLSLSDEPIKAYFHSRCGGETDSATEVWGQPGSKSRSHARCPYCRRHPFMWSSVFRFDELARALKFPYSPGAVPKLAALSRTPTGRLSVLRVQEGSHSKTLSADQFRALLGYTRIKSAHFDWHVDKDTVTVSGFGSGHGVGMCQWGARSLAQQGKSYREILSYFYPSARLIDPVSGNGLP
jgi:stage II sporulation protein D